MASASTTAEVLKGNYPAKAHCRRVADYLIEHHDVPANGILWLEGQKSGRIEDCDLDAPFRQRRHFFYLTGFPLPDAALMYDMSRSHLKLFIPQLDPESVIWSGLPITEDEVVKTFDVDSCVSTDEPVSHLQQYLETHSIKADNGTIYAIPDRYNTAAFEANKLANVETQLLSPAIDMCRVVKDAYEVALIRHANAVTAEAFMAAFRTIRKAPSERTVEAAFLERCYAAGCREQPYGGIFASGTSAATLHYVKNDAPLQLVQHAPPLDSIRKQAAMQSAMAQVDPPATDPSSSQTAKPLHQQPHAPLNMLLDAAAEYRCYAADVTRTFPVNGHFTTESRAIHDIVWEMQHGCLDMIRAGVQWEEAHELAHRVAIRGLLKLGILRHDGNSNSNNTSNKDSNSDARAVTDKSRADDEAVEAILRNRTSVAFLPHGLGHYMGLDVHDTGGRANYADPDPMFRYLRVRGPVPAGAVITVEPGIYFCRFILEPYLADPKHAPWINADVLDRYWAVGGVRIEDDILVLDDGYENLTTAIKDPEEMQRLIRDPHHAR